MSMKVLTEIEEQEWVCVCRVEAVNKLRPVLCFEGRI